MKLIWGLLMAGGFAAAQEISHVTVYYTGNAGKYFRKYPVPEGTVFKVRKTSPEQLREYLKQGMLRFAVTCEPLRGKGLKSVKLAYQAPVLAVHPKNPLRNMSSEQARGILEKNRGSWRTFNGPSARIHLYVKAAPELPPPTMQHDHAHDRSRPRTILDLPPLGGNSSEPEQSLPARKYSQPLKIQTESDAKSFSMLCTDPFGLACFDITRFDENRVRILSIDNIPPTLDNFRYGSYPLLTVYYLMLPDPPTPAEENLIRFIRSRKFARMLYQDGLLPELPGAGKNGGIPNAESEKDASR